MLTIGSWRHESARPRELWLSSTREAEDSASRLLIERAQSERDTHPSARYEGGLRREGAAPFRGLQHKCRLTKPARHLGGPHASKLSAISPIPQGVRAIQFATGGRSDRTRRYGYDRAHTG